MMIRTVSTLFAVLSVVAASAASAATLGVSGQANLFAAGQAAVTDPGTGGGGVLPPSFALPLGSGRVLSFSSVTGLTDCCSRPVQMNPEGTLNNIFNGQTNIGAGNGISGISAPGQMFLAGVFLDASTPAGGAPATLNFLTAPGGTGFSSLSPLLRQMFFIGDGLTGNGTGSAQTFQIPDSATRLFLGIADASIFNFPDHGFYNDNPGSYTAMFDVSVGSTEIPVPAALPLMLSGLGIFGWLARRRAV